jgi:cytochrome b involved in lipid metabolism
VENNALSRASDWFVDCFILAAVAEGWAPSDILSTMRMSLLKPKPDALVIKDLGIGSPVILVSFNTGLLSRKISGVAMIDLPQYTSQEVAAHKSRNDLWLIINGKGE